MLKHNPQMDLIQCIEPLVSLVSGPGPSLADGLF